LQPYYKYLLKYDYYITLLPARAEEYFISIYNNKFENVLFPQHIFRNQLTDVLIGYGKNVLVSGSLNDESDVSTINDAPFEQNSEINLDHWANLSFSHYKQRLFTNISTAEPVYLKQVYTHK